MGREVHWILFSQDRVQCWEDDNFLKMEAEIRNVSACISDCMASYTKRPVFNIERCVNLRSHNNKSSISINGEECLSWPNG